MLAQLEPLVGVLPQWQPLVRISAEVAENAGNTEKAIAFYKTELDIAGNEGSANLQTKIDSLSEVLAVKLSTPERPASSVALAAVDNEWATRVREMVGATAARATMNVKIAVLGGVPPRGWLPAAQSTLLAPQGTDEMDDYMTECTATVVDAVRLVAPDAHFIFTPTRGTGNGALGTAELLAALTRLSAARPQILLITLGPLGREFTDVLQTAINNGALIVMAAGNEPARPVPFARTPLLDRMAIAAAVDDRGQAASFTSRDDKSVWAPGVHIPVRNDRGQADKRDGTTYAAAIAAGVAAHAVASRPDAAPPDLLAALRAVPGQS